MTSLSAAFDELASRHVLLFGGKGGVGKTTLSVASALHLAKGGHEVVLFTTDPASNLSDLLHGEISAESLDAEGLYAQFLEKFAEKVLRAAGPWDRVKNWITKFGRSVKPDIHYNMTSGEVSLSLGSASH